MKKIFVVLISFLILSNTVLAVDDVHPDEGGTTTIDEVSEKIDALGSAVSALVDSSTSETSSGESGSEVSPGGNTIYVLNPSSDSSEVVENAGIDPVNDTITDINVFSAVAPVTPSDTSGLKAVLLSFLGNYDPVIVEYQYSSSQGYQNYLREVQPDYVWIASFCLLALLIFCLFRLGGALLRG